MTLNIKHNILKDLEEEIRKVHGKIIVGIAHNIIKDPSKISEMKHKYLKFHPKTNVKDTIRPPRIYMNEDEQEIDNIKQELKKLQNNDKESNDDMEQDDNIEQDSNNDKDSNDDKCIFMVRVNRKIRQCKHLKSMYSDFCTFHDNEIVYPYGLKESEDKV